MRVLEAVRLKILPLLMALTMAGCFAGYWTYSAAGGGSDTAVGEQHDVPYPAKDAFVMVQDALRGEGVPFEAKPEEHLVTDWRPGDQGPGVFGDLVGVDPRYRYEMEVVPTGQRSSRIIANVHTEDIAPDQIDSYQVTKRLSLFARFDQLASKFPPAGPTPREGGVNFALLPGEDLKGLAKRVTGSADNWQEIAKDNGLKSATDLSTVQTIWVPNTLLPQQKGSGAPK